MKVIVSNIQRFCLHDGPGIRTTVFFKGCNLRCPWCANPENIEFNIENFEDNGIIQKFGYDIELKKLEEEILKDKEFFENNGGVTFSGGEPLLQFEKIEPLLKNLKEKGINICIETALTVPENYIDIALKYVDEFIIDMKIIKETEEEKISGNSQCYLQNLKRIFNEKKDITIRIPLVPNYTLTKENLNEIMNFFDKYKPKKIEIFKIHTLSKKKYQILNKTMPIFDKISDNEIKSIKKQLESKNVLVEIIKI